MKLEFLGTGAADWALPVKNGVYTSVSDNGENRRFTSTLIDDTVLIDGTPLIADKLDRIKHIPAMLFTHSHNDHYDPAFLAEIAPKSIYCHESWSSECGATGLKLGETVDICGYEVTAIPSNHSTANADEQTVFYLIKKESDTLLYATDGAWLTNKAYHTIKKNAPLTCCVFDGTVGDDLPDDYRIFEHNTLPMVRVMRDSMLKNGLLAQNSKVFVTHLARTLHPSQRELENRERTAERPLIIAYDGMVAET